MKSPTPETSMERFHREKKARVDELRKSWPTSIECGKHPGSPRPLCERESWCREVATYKFCPKCHANYEAEKQNPGLRLAGVPANLLHARLDNWTPRNETDSEILSTVRRFANEKHGALVLLGPVGVGKSHLAVGIMRTFQRPKLIRHGGLLRALRATYGDPYAPDPIVACQRADLLVLDEFGVAVGGRDEAPTLYEILDHRHGEFLPSIITSNLSVGEFRSALGERLADRLHESLFKIITMHGESHRAERRQDYLKRCATARPIDIGESI